MIRMAYVSGSYLPSRQANSVQVMRMCDAFAASGIGVTLYARQSLTETREDIRDYYGVSDRFRIVRLPTWPLRHGREFQFAAKVRRELKRDVPDVIYGRHLLAMYASVGLAPTVYEVHSMKSRVSRVIERNMLRHRSMKMLVAISDRLALDIREGGWTGDLMTERDAADPVSYDQVEKALLPGDGHLHVGYCGQLYRGRGIELLLEVARRRPKVEFHFVGGNLDDITVFRGDSEGLSNVHFHGHVPPSRVKEFLAAFDVLVAPYQADAAAAGGEEIARWISPMKLFEYMDAGKPILISNLPAIAEVLVHDEHAILLSPSDIDAWVSAIDSLQSSGLRVRLGSSARRLVHEQYTWNKRAMRIKRQLLTYVANPGS